MSNKSVIMKITRILLSFCFLMVAAVAVAQTGLDTLKRELQHEIKSYPATVGVALIVNGRDTLALNNEVQYPLMSVFKFHQALAVADYLQRNRLTFDTPVTVEKADLKENTYSPLRDEYPQGGVTKTVGELLAYTLQLSDNNACDILFDRFVSVAETDAYIRRQGISDFAIVANEDDMHVDLSNCYRNWTSPLAAARLLDKFITGKTVTGAYQDFLQQTMTACTTGTARLPYPLQGTEAVLGHKTGTGDRNECGEYIGINDIGFVLLPGGNRYVIAVLVKDSRASYEETEAMIGRVSEIVYKHIKHLF